VVAGVGEAGDEEFDADAEPSELEDDAVLSAGFEPLLASPDFEASLLEAEAGFAEA
jgi:hypothetical protein